jgi:hypothetical protein
MIVRRPFPIALCFAIADGLEARPKENSSQQRTYGKNPKTHPVTHPRIGSSSKPIPGAVTGSLQTTRFLNIYRKIHRLLSRYFLGRHERFKGFAFCFLRLLTFAAAGF